MKRKAVVNRILNEKGETLFLLRTVHPFGWGLVGGKMEEGETEIETCYRETKEEIKLDWNVGVVSVKYIGECKSVTGREVSVFETILDHTPIIKIDKRESLNYRWIKVHNNEYQYNYTKEIDGLQFAGKTLEFVNIGRPIYFPQGIAMTGVEKIIEEAVEADNDYNQLLSSRFIDSAVIFSTE